MSGREKSSEAMPNESSQNTDKMPSHSFFTPPSGDGKSLKKKSKRRLVWFECPSPTCTWKQGNSLFYWLPSFQSASSEIEPFMIISMKLIRVFVAPQWMLNRHAVASLKWRRWQNPMKMFLTGHGTIMSYSIHNLYKKPDWESTLDEKCHPVAKLKQIIIKAQARKKEMKIALSHPGIPLTPLYWLGG